ncbi:GGDEF domain-containing protein [Oceanidesulfovibrio indonesiensis]|uniref:diguanylate cyclase n=2 Tax=Oceanidesulfovibrio indonesiensis TaxID=54767 RepID=A0A7M3MGT9_9BACT|nr:GGDEF domain-containing protein [Oceanidesulfovibrio indonesiensis]
MGRHPTEMSVGNNTPEIEELKAEMTRLGERLGSAMHTDAQRSSCFRSALVRILPGLGEAEFEFIAQDPELRSWITVPLDGGDLYPHLVHLQKRLEELSYKTDHDMLTGLLNRRAFERFLEQELNRAKRQRTRLALAVLDVDDFKIINDTYGHLCGDQVLATLGRIIDDSTRAYDTAARIGGEEFAIILPGSGPLKSRALLERLLNIFRCTEFHCEGYPSFNVTFSVGLAYLRGGDHFTPKNVLEIADKALYTAKGKGKNTVEMVKIAVEELYPKATMVHSDEKRFLFG